MSNTAYSVDVIGYVSVGFYTGTNQDTAYLHGDTDVPSTDGLDNPTAYGGSNGSGGSNEVVANNFPNGHVHFD
jgi:hypothetical protein